MKAGDGIRAPLYTSYLSLSLGVYSGIKVGYGGAALKKPSLGYNYHPVSNFSFLDKVIESVGTEELQTFLEDALVLDPFQSDFPSMEWRQC